MSDQAENNGERAGLPATAAQAGMGSFPVGSVESRAAARLLLERRRESEKRFEILLCMSGIDGPRAFEWTRERDGTISRRVWLPGGEDMMKCLKQVGGFSEDEIAAIVDRHPTVPGFEIITLSQ